MKLLLIRHPRPSLDGKQYCYGQLNLGLAHHALDCVPSLQQDLADFGPAELFCSPLQRCTLLAEALGLPWRSDYRLMERHFGHWEGRAWRSLAAEQFDPWLANPWGFAPPGGESSLTLAQRLFDFLSDIKPNRAILITHAGIIRMLQSWFHNLKLADTSALEFGHASLITGDLMQARLALEEVINGHWFDRA